MKTKKWVYVLVGVLATLGFVLGAVFDNMGWFISSGASAESVLDEASTTRVSRLDDTEYQDFNFESENINQILRKYEALNKADAQVFDFGSENINQILRNYEALNKTDAQVIELEPENINQILREFEALNDIQEGARDSRKALIELDDDPLQKEIRFNLPEGIN